MSPDPQHTLAAPVSFSGVGVHTGATVYVTISPAAVGSGIRFLRTDGDAAGSVIAARTERVSQTRLGTVIENGSGVQVSTVEHLMASFCGLGIDNALVQLDGGEVPIMDGSCEPFVRWLDLAGRQPQSQPRRYVEILKPVEVRDAEKRAALLPAEQFEICCEIRFEAAAIGRQCLDLVLDEGVFRRQLADCRTFGFHHEVEALRQAGLARGGSLDNAIVIENGAVLNPEGLRCGDEFVRHKMVDAIGDLYLLGGPLLGRYEGVCAGHTLNNALARALLAQPEAWRWAHSSARLAKAG